MARAAGPPPGGAPRRVRRSEIGRPGAGPPVVVLPDGRGGLVRPGSRRRRKWGWGRRLLVGAALGGVLLVLAVGAVAVAVSGSPERAAALRARVKPFAQRVLAWVPGRGSAWNAAAAERHAPARLACTPAVPAGTPGAPRPLAQLGPAERATVVWQWADTVRQASAERRALQAVAATRGLTVQAVGTRGAVAVTAGGDDLRALGGRAPGAAAFTAAPNARSLCVLD